MNAQIKSRWLFEAPLASEAMQYANPYASQEYFGYPELEGEVVYESSPQQRLVGRGQIIDASTGPDLLNAGQVAVAIQQNRLYRQQLWGYLYRPISIYYLRYYYMSPTEAGFAQAVARWQQAVGGLKVNGILDKRTWSIMRLHAEPHTFWTPEGIKRPHGKKQVLATFGNPGTNRARITLPPGKKFIKALSGPKKYLLGNRFLKLHFERLLKAFADAGLWNDIQPVSGPVDGAMHAFAIAIDINPHAYPHRMPPPGKSVPYPNPRVIQIFQDYGFHWGVFWKTPDPMHFQFATGA